MSARDAAAMSPLQVAAANAEAEAEALYAEALNALVLEDISGVLYDAATDAIDAYRRARDRAGQARLLADHHCGGYNVWQPDRPGR